MSPEVVAAVQVIVGVLSVPTIAAFIAWIAKRFTKESRLLVRVERLAAIYPNLPEGTERAELATRLSESTRELNRRLDPLFKRERSLKRKVVLWVTSLLILATLIFFPASSSSGFSSTAGLIGGGVAIVAFLLIERDTRRQRTILNRQNGSPPAGR
jgi:hypothetical protein